MATKTINLGSNQGAYSATFAVRYTTNITSIILNSSSAKITLPTVEVACASSTLPPPAEYGSNRLDCQNSWSGVKIGSQRYYSSVWAGQGVSYGQFITGQSGSEQTLQTSNIFNASNKNNRSLEMYLTSKFAYLSISNNLGQNRATRVENAYTEYSFDTPVMVTLDAPPTFTTTQVTSTDVFAIGKVAKVKLANLSAQYGGDISETKLTIGEQTSTVVDADGFISITLNSAGRKNCSVKVTDSRGQVTEQQLDSIWVWDVVPQWITPVTDRPNERTRTTYVDMTRIATDCAFVGGLNEKTVYMINDIVLSTEWSKIVQMAQSIDNTVTSSTRYDNLNKIEQAFKSASSFILGTSKLGKGVLQ